jgi:ketosteroid isomerase-like protein
LGADPGSGREATRGEPLALIEAFRSAYERRDLDAVMELFGSDPHERDQKGRAAVHRLYARNFAVLDQIRYELTQLEVRPAAGEVALVVQGRFRIQAASLAGPSRPLDVAGRVRWHLRREWSVLRIAGIDCGW